MGKTIRAEITYTLEFDDNGFLEWENEQGNLWYEDGKPRTEVEMLEFAREELYELLTNGVKYNDLWNMIDVKVIQKEDN